MKKETCAIFVLALLLLFVTVASHIILTNKFSQLRIMSVTPSAESSIKPGVMTATASASVSVEVLKSFKSNT